MVSNETGKPFDISKMAIGTVHSICNGIIGDRKFSEQGARRNTLKVMDELDQYLHLYQRNNWVELIGVGGYDSEEEAQRSINVFFGSGNRSSRHEAVRNVIKLFNRFSEEHFDEAKAKSKDKDVEGLIKMYTHYLDRLGKMHPRISIVDLSLLQVEAFKAITSTGAAAFSRRSCATAASTCSRTSGRSRRSASST
jgi:DNA helicase-2/ATP-dependent DNA helicase PcrA